MSVRLEGPIFTGETHPPSSGSLSRPEGGVSHQPVLTARGAPSEALGKPRSSPVPQGDGPPAGTGGARGRGLHGRFRGESGTQIRSRGRRIHPGVPRGWECEWPRQHRAREQGGQAQRERSTAAAGGFCSGAARRRGAAAALSFPFSTTFSPSHSPWSDQIK